MFRVYFVFVFLFVLKFPFFWKVPFCHVSKTEDFVDTRRRQKQRETTFFVPLSSTNARFVVPFPFEKGTTYIDFFFRKGGGGGRGGGREDEEETRAGEACFWINDDAVSSSRESESSTSSSSTSVVDGEKNDGAKSSPWCRDRRKQRQTKEAKKVVVGRGDRVRKQRRRGKSHRWDVSRRFS